MPNPKGYNQYKKKGGGGSRKPKGGPTSTNVSTGKQINRIDAAEKMFGKGSAQHKAAIKKFGK